MWQETQGIQDLFEISQGSGHRKSKESCLTMLFLPRQTRIGLQEPGKNDVKIVD
jgi:hypothetical protein